MTEQPDVTQPGDYPGANDHITPLPRWTTLPDDPAPLRKELARKRAEEQQ